MKTKEVLNEGLKRGYECSIPATDVEKAMEKELQNIGARAKIAGFRPGKIPLKILQQRYGTAVQADVVRNLVTEGVTQVIQEKELRPALTPKLEEDAYQPGKDLTFKFSFEVLPDVPEMNFSDISITREVYEVTEEDINEALGRLAKHSPEPKDLPKTAKAEKGNVVTMNFEGKLNGQLFDGGSAKEYPIELGSGQFISGFEEQLEGLKAGDKKCVEVNFPENYFNKELAGQPATFDVEVLKVAELVTPEINEEFAKNRNFADLRALKEAVRDQLKKEFDSIVRTNTKKSLFDALEEQVDFPIPQSMFDLEFDAIWQKVQAAKDDDEDLKGKSEAELKTEYTAIASRRVRLGILLADIGRREKLGVTREELSRALMAYAGNFPGQEARVVEFYKANPERLDEFRGPILEDKAVDWIFSKISYTDQPTSINALLEGANAGSGEEGGEAKKKSPAKKKAPAKPKAKKEGDE